MTRRLVPVMAETSAPRPAPAVSNAKDAIDTLARTLWAEARAQPVRGIEALAAVILNRAGRAAADGLAPSARVAAACRDPAGFACWDEGHPDNAAMLAVAGTDLVFATCLRVARRALAGLLPDPTGGATRYHNRSDHPIWAAGRSPSAEIGDRLFYTCAP